jgi:hypothetical protein
LEDKISIEFEKESGLSLLNLTEFCDDGSTQGFGEWLTYT